MRVTVVTPSLNQGRFLERALDSVLGQGHPDIECIVVDGGSTDGSREIVERYRPRLAHVVLEPDDGPADALNKGLARATGEIFACVNADDWLLPGAVEQAVAAFRRFPDAGAVYASGYFADADGTRRRRFRSTPFDLRRFAYGGVNVMHQATFVRRSAYEAVGGFNVANRTSWDGELLVDLSMAGFDLVRTEGLWGVFTLHPESISGSGRLLAEYDDDRARMFAKVLGRGPAARDRWHFTWARVAKWLADPAYLIWRLSDAVRERDAAVVGR
jgi:glycosyltransferase involved in cell wall biosynthesis